MQDKKDLIVMEALSLPLHIVYDNIMFFCPTLMALGGAHKLALAFFLSNFDYKSSFSTSRTLWYTLLYQRLF